MKADAGESTSMIDFPEPLFETQLNARRVCLVCRRT